MHGAYRDFLAVVVGEQTTHAVFLFQIDRLRFEVVFVEISVTIKAMDYVNHCFASLKTSPLAVLISASYFSLNSEAK